MKNRSIKVRRRFIKSENDMPKALIFAEIFIAVLCMSYILKIGGLALDIAKADTPSLVNVALLEMDVIFFGMTVFAALGVYSHRPESWRKVVRSCVTFTVAMIISAVYTNDGSAHVFDFNPVITFIALVALLLMMLLNKNVKKFYTPPMMEVPRTKEWIRFAFFGKLIDSEYSIVFSDTKMRSRSEIAADPNFPDEIGPIINEIADNHNL